MKPSTSEPRRAFFVVDSETEVAKIWHIELPDHAGNVLAVVARQAAGPWTARYRFRYYEDADCGLTSKDRKSEWKVSSTSEGSLAEDRAALVGAFDAMFERMSRELSMPFDTCAEGAVGTEVTDAIFAASWSHATRLSKGGDA